MRLLGWRGWPVSIVWNSINVSPEWVFVQVRWRRLFSLLVFAQPIVSRAKPEMLKSHFIPTMEKLKKRTSKVVAEEDHLRMEGKSEGDEEDGTIRDEFAVLCRDLYALYPLLIRYVDNNRYNGITNRFWSMNHTWYWQEVIYSAYRARWLTCPDPDAEELFRMVGEVFIFWSKSHVSTFIWLSNAAICSSLHPLLYVSPISLSIPSRRTSSERSKTLWWWMRSITCRSSPLTARAKWPRWVHQRQSRCCGEAARSQILCNSSWCSFLCALVSEPILNGHLWNSP